jgi:hypothetical protein
MIAGLFFRHDLHIHFPFRKIAFFNIFNRSLWFDSLSVPIIFTASSLVKFSIPCWVLKVNLTQCLSFFALIKLNVWLPNPCICRYDFRSAYSGGLNILVIRHRSSRAGSQLLAAFFFLVQLLIWMNKLTPKVTIFYSNSTCSR